MGVASVTMPSPGGSVPTVRVNEISLEYEWWGAAGDEPPVLLLHEAMGSVRSWEGFGERLARASDRRVYAYSRQGHGSSEPLLEPLADDYVEREGLEVLPALREALRLDEVVLLGLGEGASMALVHAGGSGLETHGVIAIAPLIATDDVTVDAVRAMARQFERSPLKETLASLTGDTEATFRQWAKLWLGRKREKWRIDDFVRGVTCRVLALRGEHDGFTSAQQLDRLAGLAHRVELVHLRGCRNAPHQEKPGAVIAELSSFLRQLSADEDT